MTLPTFSTNQVLTSSDLNDMVDAINDVPNQYGLPTARVTTASNGTTTSAGTETRDAVLGNLAFTAVDTVRMEVHLHGRMLFGNSTSAGDRYKINIRDGGASTPTASSTLAAQLNVVLLGSGF